MALDRLEGPASLTTSQVAELLDVHPSTVKRWCNDDELSSDKTEGGHRRIHLADALGLARERGIPTFLDPFVPYEGHVWQAITDAAESGSFDRVHALALGWLDRGRIERIGHLFHELGRHPRIPFELFADLGIRDFMVRIGELWEGGQLRAGEEHITTGILVDTLLRLRDESPAIGTGVGEGSIRKAHLVAPPTGTDDRHSTLSSPAPAAVAVVGAMEGDRHALAPLCVRIVLERRGWRVLYLGADVPVEDFSAIQRQHGARLVCISFAPPNTGADMQRCVRILSEFHDRSTPCALVLGGSVRPLETTREAATPFEELRIFHTLVDFGEVLDAGLAGAGLLSA
ncbi:MAG: excisionase family DNA-binding protein [Longimicrobiales bacterium]|nr:excisionase family DNA-binding protein [Longimicrobiales bacterium]